MMIPVAHGVSFGRAYFNMLFIRVGKLDRIESFGDLCICRGFSMATSLLTSYICFEPNVALHIKREIVKGLSCITCQRYELRVCTYPLFLA